jgi:hypothetical protein
MLQCDCVYSSSDARFQAASSLLPARFVGIDRATELLLFGEMVSAPKPTISGALHLIGE